MWNTFSSSVPWAERGPSLDVKNQLAARLRENPLLQAMQREEEIFWLNGNKLPWAECRKAMPWEKDTAEAEARLRRFAPVIQHYFPETASAGGIIESPLKEIPAMGKQRNLTGRLLIKLDSALPVSGSVRPGAAFMKS